MSNAALIRRIFEEGWNHASFDVLEGVADGDIPFHYNGATTTVTLASLPPLVASWRGGFPDLEMVLRHVIEQGDLVAVSLTLTGTHLGEWRGLPPSGNHVQAEEMMFFRFDGERLAEMWEVFDEQGLLSQLRD